MEKYTIKVVKTNARVNNPMVEEVWARLYRGNRQVSEIFACNTDELLAKACQRWGGSGVVSSVTTVDRRTFTEYPNPTFRGRQDCPLSELEISRISSRYGNPEATIVVGTATAQV